MKLNSWVLLLLRQFVTKLSTMTSDHKLTPFSELKALLSEPLPVHPSPVLLRPYTLPPAGKKTQSRISTVEPQPRFDTRFALSALPWRPSATCDRITEVSKDVITTGISTSTTTSTITSTTTSTTISTTRSTVPASKSIKKKPRGRPRRQPPKQESLPVSPFYDFVESCRKMRITALVYKGEPMFVIGDLITYVKGPSAVIGASDKQHIVRVIMMLKGVVTRELLCVSVSGFRKLMIVWGAYFIRAKSLLGIMESIMSRTLPKK